MCFTKTVDIAGPQPLSEVDLRARLLGAVEEPRLPLQQLADRSKQRLLPSSHQVLGENTTRRNHQGSASYNSLLS